jgi:hypothetical protein
MGLDCCKARQRLAGIRPVAKPMGQTQSKRAIRSSDAAGGGAVINADALDQKLVFSRKDLHIGHIVTSVAVERFCWVDGLKHRQFPSPLSFPHFRQRFQRQR